MSELPAEVSNSELVQLIDNAESDALLILDCRRPEEYELVHLANSVLIPMDEIAARVEELTPHADKQIIVYCHMGVRSGMVSRWLRDNGFPKTQSLAGGIDAWSVQIDPQLPRY